MTAPIDVAVIGAGHAGLNAIKEIRKVTDNWVLINGGPLGTTCARIGCMPSKIALQLAETYKAHERLSRWGIAAGDEPALDQAAALEHVRDLRDTFVDLLLANTTDEMREDHLVEGYAELIDKSTVRVGDREIRARAVVIATGARSVIPPEWARDFGDGILTVDTLFDQQRLPESVAVIGLGPIGIEIGQTLRRLGVAVTGFDHGERISRIKDPAVNRAAIEILGREFPLVLGHEAQVEHCEGGFLVRAGGHRAQVEKLFLALGRHPNLAGLHLERLGAPLDVHGVPAHDAATLNVKGTHIYLAGDAAGGIANLQRAAEQGRIAGWNATHRRKRVYPKRTHMAIVFSEPNIACVGREWDRLDLNQIAVAEQRFGPVGRALIMGQNRGMLRLYADRRSRRLLGASLVGPRCEHLAHLISWAVENRMTVERALEMPFYHPVIEEALQDALQALRAALAPARGRRPIRRRAAAKIQSTAGAAARA